jgi:hypothetical protein
LIAAGTSGSSGSSNAIFVSSASDTVARYSRRRRCGWQQETLPREAEPVDRLEPDADVFSDHLA